MTRSAYLIDWLTLRLPLDEIDNGALRTRIRDCLHTLHCSDSDGALVWTKKVLDLDSLRSDSVGLFWQLQSDGKREYLAIGGSPATLEHGLNVFGELDIQHCAAVVIRAACQELGAILPPFDRWQCRRIDITGNFALPDAAAVKQSLKQLLVADGSRRKAGSVKDSDSVYWNQSSDLRKGKAYHKGPQLRRLVRIGKLQCDEEHLALADRLLRFEHTCGARWFRRLQEDGKCWFDLTNTELVGLFVDFFEKLTGGVEVRDMGRNELVKRIQTANDITEGRACAAFTTYRNIRTDGFEVVQDYMPRSTFLLHVKYLRAAGFTDAELRSGNVIPFRPVRVILAQPVGSWSELRAA